MKNRSKKIQKALLYPEDYLQKNLEEDSKKSFICLICGTKQLGAEMDYHPAPHCKSCDSRLVMEVMNDEEFA